MVSEHVEGDRVEHERYGLGTVEARAETATGYAARSPPRVRVRWDEPDGADDVTTVLTEHVTPTTAP